MQSLEKNSLSLPKIIYGTSGLGNLFVVLSEDQKLNIIKECIFKSSGVVAFDSAGKYGAGLALEALANCLNKLNIPPSDVLISNKLGWARTELRTKEPTFEPGVWKDLTHDAVQKISYDGIMECFEEGNKLLSPYIPQMVSVHDPDEYLATAEDEEHSHELYADIVQAYQALQELKKQNKVLAIGVGAKNWKVIQRIAKDVQLDWMMIANSMTIKQHPQDLINFIEEMSQKGIYVINSAVFHSGFLVGGNYYDYQMINPGIPKANDLLKWRKDFFQTCQAFKIKPAAACIQFALKVPGVKSIAFNPSNKREVKENYYNIDILIQNEFWNTMSEKKLISADCLRWLN